MRDGDRLAIVNQPAEAARTRQDGAGSLTLTASLRPAALDARRGVVRLHREVLAALGMRPGDPVGLTGRRTTAGIVAPADPAASRGLLYADDLTLGNLGVRDGAQVTIGPVPMRAAGSVALSGPPEVAAVVSPEMLRLALLGKVITVGDDVSLLPQDVTPGPDARRLVEAARRSLANTMGYGWTSALLTVVDADPPNAALVTMDTTVGWLDGHRTHPTTAAAAAAGSAGAGSAAAGSAAADPGTTTGTAPAQVLATPPRVEDLPGLRAQADQLTELLDLGYHHREVLTRLGTSVTMGILIAGPAGSGKSAMVTAVAGELDARRVTLWAPELAVLTANDAAARLRAAADEVRTAPNGILLIVDVEALAPRESPGPLATVFRQVAAGLLAEQHAVIVTTGRPEAVDPSLRSPGLLEHEIVVALPDQALRRAQLDVLTRSMPLADDVTLDGIAARTPGFVLADLAALIREAGVRAALRYRSTNPETGPTVTMGDFEAALDAVLPTSMAASSVELAPVTLDDVGDLADVKEILTESVLWPLSYPDAFARLGVSPPRGVLLYGPPGCGKTYLVKAIAGTGRANLLSVKGAELLSKWVGESERAVRELLRRARDAAPTLVFLDEIDALAPVRGQSSDVGTTDRVVAALLTELDGVESLRNVVVIGATNRPDLVDPALLRPGRLERLVYVPPPDGPARAAILRAATRGVPIDPAVDLDALAENLGGFSAADCAALIREAALAAMRQSLDASAVTAEHVAAARGRVRPSLDPIQVAWLAAYAEQHVPG
jgi:transitional endoplasmic reticulum ATPase